MIESVGNEDETCQQRSDSLAIKKPYLLLDQYLDTS